MTTSLDDILPRKQPMPPAKAAHMIEQLQVADSGFDILAAVITDTDRLGLLPDAGEELTMRLRTVTAEVLQDLREWVRWHWDLQQPIEEWDDAVVRSRFSTDEHGPAIVVTFVDDAVGKHGLVGDAEDESTVGEVVFWFGLRPHRFHRLLDYFHSVEQQGEGFQHPRLAIRGNGIKQLRASTDEIRSALDHMDVREYEARLGR